MPIFNIAKYQKITLLAGAAPAQNFELTEAQRHLILTLIEAAPASFWADRQVLSATETIEAANLLDDLKRRLMSSP